jgi:hypothetical protein
LTFSGNKNEYSGMNIMTIVFTFFLSLNALARTEICPDNSPSEVIPKVEVKVKLDNKTSQYRYQFKLSNLPESKVPIWRFSIEADAAPISTLSPAGWMPAVYDNKTKEIYWTYDASLKRATYIRPGGRMGGFEIISKKPPGVVKSWVDGDVADIPIVKFENDEEEIDPEAIVCPGFYNGSGHSDYVVFATKGPAIENRLEAKIRIKKTDGKVWYGSPHLPADLEFSPVDYGQIDLVLLGSKAIDVNKIDYTTIKFGEGKASFVPVKKAIIEEFKDVSDNEIYQFLQKNKSQHMLLAFNLQEVEVRCNLDRSLFFTAKLGSKDLFAAVNILPSECNLKTFAREAKKDKYKKSKSLDSEKEE